jgi:DNA-directed RNA polymerase specialized sigma24 family protein
MKALITPPVMQRDAFTTFVQENEESIYGLCYCLLHDAGAAEVVTQRVLANAYPHFSELTSQALLETACCYCLACLSSLPEQFFQNSHSCHPEHNHPHVASAKEEALQSLLDQLTAESRAILLLHDRFRLPFAEIAAVLKTDASTVRLRLYQARHEAAEILRGEAAVQVDTRLPSIRQTQAWVSDETRDAVPVLADGHAIS